MKARKLNLKSIQKNLGGGLIDVIAFAWVCVLEYLKTYQRINSWIYWSLSVFIMLFGAWRRGLLQYYT